MLPRDDIRGVLVILTKAVAGKADVRFQWLRTEWRKGVIVSKSQTFAPSLKLGDSIALALTSLETYSLEYSF